MAKKSLTATLNSRIKKIASKEKTPAKRNAMEAKIIKRMASAAGIKPTTVRQILNGTISDPPDRRLRGFARVLDISFSTLDKTSKKKPVNRSKRK